MNEPRYLQGHELERFLASPYCPDYIRAHPERYEVLYLGGTDLQWCYTHEYWTELLIDFETNLTKRHVTTLSERTGPKGRKARR
mgnify:CR=1 FL=1